MSRMRLVLSHKNHRPILRTLVNTPLLKDEAHNALMTGLESSSGTVTHAPVNLNISKEPKNYRVMKIVEVLQF